MSLVDAEAYLLSDTFYKTAFDRWNSDILEALCSQYQLVVTPTGTRLSPLKKDYIQALNTYKVRRCIGPTFFR